MPIEPTSEPLKVTAEKGYVLLEGKSGVAITMTAPAAIETGDALLEGAAEALGREAMEQVRRQRPE